MMSLFTPFLSFGNKMQEGGAIFMYPILFTLLTCIGLIIYALVKGDNTNKIQKLISSISLLALVWGFTGQIMGLISVLDVLSIDSKIAYGILAGGIKVGLLSPLFGMITFLIARIGIIILILKKK